MVQRMSVPSFEEYLEFIYTDEFLDSADGLLGDAEFSALEAELLTAPTTGRIIPGTGGVRKMRFALPGRGKSGGARVLYVYSPHDQRIFFLLTYSKNVRDTLTQAEKHALKQWVQTL
jgi:hypothetical protein